MIWSWLLHPGSRWMPYVLISSKFGSDWWSILGHPHLIECMGICVLSLARVSELRGSTKYLEVFLLLQSGYVPVRDGLCLDFFGIFLIFLRGGCGEIIYREYIVFRSSNISCSLACTPTDRFLSVYFVLFYFFIWYACKLKHFVISM